MNDAPFQELQDALRELGRTIRLEGARDIQRIVGSRPGRWATIKFHRAWGRYHYRRRGFGGDCGHQLAMHIGSAYAHHHRRLTHHVDRIKAIQGVMP